MAAPTTQDYDNAQTDLGQIADVANGSETLNGNGQVPLRLGGFTRTLRKVMADLEAAFRATFNYRYRGAWATGVAYTARDQVLQGGVVYVATVDHTAAAAFATDLNAGRWAVYQGLTNQDVDPVQLKAVNQSYILQAVAAAVAGRAITIAAEGDSLTYAQDTTPNGQNTQINGATQTRSTRNFPDELREALSFANITATVTNRGFPGDSTIEGLARWAGAAATDFVTLMYGTNDLMNYGQYQHGRVPVSQYSANLEAMIIRRIQQGTGVIILGMPNLQDQDNTRLLQPYKLAAMELAEKYGCPFIDTAEILQSIPYVWTDTIHLTSTGYAEIGWQIAPFLAARLGRGIKVSAGDVFTGADGLLQGGSLLFEDRARYGFYTRLAPGQSIGIPVEATDTVVPRVSIFAPDGACVVGAYYSGDGNGRGVPVSTAIVEGTPRATLVCPTLRRGSRLLVLRNDHPSLNAIIEQIRFDRTGEHMSKGAFRRVEALMGMFQPRRLSAALNALWTFTDFSTRMRPPYNFSARLTLTDAGAGNRNGLAFYTGTAQISSDFSNQGGGFAVVRDVDSLVLFDFALGSPGTPTTAAGVFTAGAAWTGEIEVEVTATNINVHVDGVQKLTRAIGSVAVNPVSPGLWSAKGCNMVCHAALASDTIKTPI